MPLSLVTGPANSGKANVVLAALRGHVARAEGDPLLVVPTDADQARYRRELAESNLSSGVRVERFQGLFAEVLARAGRAEAALGKLARERLIASLAGAQPGLSKALAESVAELQVARIDPATLGNAVEPSGAQGHERLPASEQPVIARLCEVFDAYSEELARLGRADVELRTVRALDELRRRPALWGDTPVLLYGFDSFTELELDAIETLGGAVDAPVTVSLAYEPGRRAFAGRAAAFQRLLPLAASHTALDPRADYYADASRNPLHHLERSLFEDRPARVDADGAVRLLEGSTPRAELELVAGEIRALLDAGTPPGEIAIVHRSPEAVGALLSEVLDHHGVPHTLRLRERFSHSAIGRALLGLMRCALLDSRLEDLLAWLRAPGVLTRPELADRLEADARRLGLRDAEHARTLWESEHWPLDRIDRLSAAAERGPVALIDALCSELERLFAAPRSGRAEVLGRRELAEARALAAARGALEELRDLARVAPEHVSGPAALIDALEQLETADRSPLLPNAVTVVSPLSLRARRVRARFVCGMQEGVFPASARSDSLISKHHRRNLALVAGIRLAGVDDSVDALDRERHLLYAICSRPEERLTLSWHTAHEDGSPAVRSLFVDDICDLFSERLCDEVRRDPAAPPVERVVDCDDPRSTEEIVVRRLTEDERAIVAEDRPIDPLGDERVLAALREQTQWSASSLECFNACPVRWFVERLLRPDTLDPDPEPLARGALAHAALKQTLERLRERTGSARICSSSLALAKRLLAEALEELAEQHSLSAAPERIPGARRRLGSDLERYLEWAAENDTRLEPTHLEMAFDSLELGEGVTVRGRIDRIDLTPQGDAVVYDYKARSATPSAKWLSEGALQVALYMHATEQLLDRTVVGGLYQPLSGKELRPRGVLDSDSEIEMAGYRTDRCERSELRDLLDRCRRVALDAAEQARAGALEPRPHTCSYNGGCMYPAICRAGAER
ncbi:MAG: PD-(D/E)XK nuclease family protein [Solirubrobacteraceae bacterium]